MKRRFRKNLYRDLIFNHHHQEADDMNYLSIGAGGGATKSTDDFLHRKH